MAVGLYMQEQCNPYTIYSHSLYFVVRSVIDNDDDDDDDICKNNVIHIQLIGL